MAPPRSSFLSLVGVVALLALPLPSLAMTLPDQAARAYWFRDAVRARSPAWRDATKDWLNEDLCGPDWQGRWQHISCRGGSQGWGESSDGKFDGVVNSLHTTSVDLNGALPRELCVLKDLRQLDVGGRSGAGRFVGPIEDWVATCFPKLEELDLSMHRLTGTIPALLAQHPLLSEIKLEGNNLVGGIPPEFGRMNRLRRFQIEYNDLSGPAAPASFANETLSRQLTQLHLAGNNFTGDLKALAGVRLFTVSVHENPGLCGMVPAGVRYAAGYNPAGTRLGQPC